jgi:ABC-type dipeptide/oligopeptide/nickel transport system ATPase component
MPQATFLEVNNLTVKFRSSAGTTEAVRNVSFHLNHGETLAVVGESGSGKSVTGLALTRLLAPTASFTSESRICLDGRQILSLPEDDLRKIRGKDIAYVFQEPSTSLNPVFSIRQQIGETIRLHRPEVTDITSEILRFLDMVGIVDAPKRLDDYPHQLSGGMQQRVMIAMALSGQPKLLVADEPTTALDVTIQKQILDQLRLLKQQLNMAMILITHNFAIISGIADRVAVMFRGEIVESGPAREVLANPQHPYTQALIKCVPKLGQRIHRLPVISDFLAS